MSVVEKIRSNAEVHGIKWASTYAYNHGYNIDTVLYALFGKYSGTRKEVK